MRKFARYYLENKGYFTFPQNNTRLITSDEIAALDLNALRKVGGDETKLILLLTVERVSKLYTVIVNTAEAVIRARLISKESNKIIWEKNMSYDHISLGAFTAGGLATVIKYGGFGKMALYKATKQLNDLPSYEGMVIVE